MNKKPKLRFPGFTDDWEQRKLGELVDYVVDNRGKNPNYYCEEGIPVIDNYMIKNVLYPDLSTANRFIDENLYENFIRKYCEKDDILITLVGNGIGNITLFPDEKAVIIQNTLGLRTTEDKRFLFFLIMAHNKEIVSLDRGMAQPSIRQDEILDVDMYVPQIEEQVKLGEYFSNLDNLITLHQRKLDNIKEYKTGMLQKMFPKEGEDIPEVRFPGFTDAWEQRKLGDITNIIDPHPSHRAPEAVNEGIPFIGIGDVDALGNIDKDSARTVDEAIYDEHHRRYNLDIPSLGIGRVASLGKVIRLRNDIGKYAVSPTMSIIQFQDTVDIDYMYSCMEAPVFQKQFAAQSNGSTRQSVGIQDLRELLVSVPQNEHEQKQIGRFFKEVDSLITLHQRKLDELKEYKQGLLQQMFA